jgi:hypothetical protein
MRRSSCWKFLANENISALRLEAVSTAPST